MHCIDTSVFDSDPTTTVVQLFTTPRKNMESRISNYIVESCSIAWLPVTVFYTSLCCRDTGAGQSFPSTYIFMHANFNSTSCIVYNLLSLFLCPVHVYLYSD